MVVAARVARVNECHFIDVLGHAGKNLADPRSRFPVAGELEWRLHHRAHLRGKKARVLVETFQFLSVALFQFWLVLPRVHVTWATVHEQPNDALRFRRKVAPLGRKWVQSWIRSRAGGTIGCLSG